MVTSPMTLRDPMTSVLTSHLSTKNELIQSRGVCRLSVCKLFLRESLLLRQKWLDRYQSCIEWSARGHASRLCSRSRSRSKVTWYGHFCARPKIAFSRRQMARLRPNLHTMVSGSACIQGVLKVKVKDTGTFVLARKPLLLAGKQLSCDLTCTRWSTGEPVSRVCSRSSDTGTVLMARIAFLLAGKLDPKPPKIRYIRQICSSSQKAAKKSSAKPNIS